jgi:RhtB (resistance to homoserine/threonine) family protein
VIDAQTLAFIGVAALLTITPGADTMLVMRSVIARGQQAGLLTTLGICMGLFVHATLSALGLSFILVQSATVYEIVKFAGACYLIFLGVQSIRQALRREPADTTPDAAAQQAAPAAPTWRRSFLEGMLSNVLNPKVAVFYLAFLPQFISPGDPVLARSVLLAAIHFVMGIAWLSVLVFFLGKIGSFLNRPAVRRKLEATTGMILIGFGVGLALERR